MKRYLIVNGDDFGASRGIDAGILRAHHDGILTSASLMVNMPRSREAAALSDALPAASIGLHANFTNEGAGPVVDLADVAACRTELRRQFTDFVRLMGRPPTHVDSHHNVHRLPGLLPLFLDLAAEHELPLREHSPARYHSSFYGQWDGVPHPEQISPDSLIRMLRTQMDTQVTELGCHPGYVDPDFSSVYHVERETELRTLCDPRVGRTVAALGFVLISFRDLVPLTVRDQLRGGPG